MTLTSFGGGYGNAGQRNQYLADSVLSAPPARLLTMLYDRLLLDLGRAETAQQAADWTTASEAAARPGHRGRAVLRLKVDAWDGANGLLGLYNDVSTALINANIQRDAALTREAIELLEPLRQTWHEAAAAVPVPATPAAFSAAAPAGFPAAGAWNTGPGTGGGSLGFG